MSTYFALRRICTRPASADSVREAPPTTTFPTLSTRYSWQSAATFSSDSRRVTTMISSTQLQAFSAVSVLASTGFPARSIKSLSSPIRVEAPAATTTTLQEVFLARRRKSEKRLIGLIHSVFSVCAGTDPAEPPRSHTDNSRRGISPRAGSAAPD